MLNCGRLPLFINFSVEDGGGEADMRGALEV